MSVRAKVMVTELNHRGYEPGVVSQVDMVARAVYCGRTHATEEEKAACESHSYSAATPNGKIELTITNPAAFEQFKIGQRFYVDFIPAPAE